MGLVDAALAFSHELVVARVAFEAPEPGQLRKEPSRRAGIARTGAVSAATASSFRPSFAASAARSSLENGFSSELPEFCEVLLRERVRLRAATGRAVDAQHRGEELALADQAGAQSTDRALGHGVAPIQPQRRLGITLLDSEPEGLFRDAVGAFACASRLRTAPTS